MSVNNDNLKYEEINKITEIKDSILNYNRLNPNLNLKILYKVLVMKLLYHIQKKVYEQVSRYNPIFMEA